MKKCFQGLHRFDARGLGLLPLQGQPRRGRPAVVAPALDKSGGVRRLAVAGPAAAATAPTRCGPSAWPLVIILGFALLYGAASGSSTPRSAVPGRPKVTAREPRDDRADDERVGVHLGHGRHPRGRQGVDERAGHGRERDGHAPVADLLKNLNKTVATAGGTLTNADKLLNNASQLIAPDSELDTGLNNLLLQGGDAARSLRVLMDYLERHPEALIRGKTGEAKP